MCLFIVCAYIQATFLSFLESEPYVIVMISAGAMMTDLTCIVCLESYL
jgi:hypothetical protein